VRRSWWSNGTLASAAVAASTLVQSPGFRVVYAVRVLTRSAGVTRVAAVGGVSGPEATGLRLSLRTDTVVVEALLTATSDEDSVTLDGAFVTRRLAGRSRRALPLWEEDGYRRAVRIPWGHPVQLYPLGPGDAGTAEWIELTVTRGFVGGETPPEETYEIADSSIAVGVEAVLPPRRAQLRMHLVHGDSTSAPEGLDLAVEGPSRRVTFVLGRRAAQELDVRLARPEPARTLRDSALAEDADEVCLRITDPLVPQPAWTGCGRLNTVARRIPLSGPDTLVVAFAWPVAR
jgi:hypothetical protein